MRDLDGLREHVATGRVAAETLLFDDLTGHFGPAGTHEAYRFLLEMFGQRKKAAGRTGEAAQEEAAPLGGVRMTLAEPDLESSDEFVARMKKERAREDSDTIPDLSAALVNPYNQTLRSWSLEPKDRDEAKGRDAGGVPPTLESPAPALRRRAEPKSRRPAAPRPAATASAPTPSGPTEPATAASPAPPEPGRSDALERGRKAMLSLVTFASRLVSDITPSSHAPVDEGRSDEERIFTERTHPKELDGDFHIEPVPEHETLLPRREVPDPARPSSRPAEGSAEGAAEVLAVLQDPLPEIDDDLVPLDELRRELRSRRVRSRNVRSGSGRALTTLRRAGVAALLVVGTGWLALQAVAATITDEPAPEAREAAGPPPLDPRGVADRLAASEGIAFQHMVEGMDALAREHGVAEAPSVWLEGEYMSGAAAHPEVETYWERYSAFARTLRERDAELFRASFLDRLGELGVSQSVASLRMAQATRRFEETQPLRDGMYDRMDDLAAAALTLHDLLVSRASDIRHTPLSRAATVRDPFLQIYTEDEALQERIYALLDRIFEDLEALHGETRWTRSRLNDGVLEGIRATGEAPADGP